MRASPPGGRGAVKGQGCRLEGCYHFGKAQRALGTVVSTPVRLGGGCPSDLGLKRGRHNICMHLLSAVVTPPARAGDAPIRRYAPDALTGDACVGRI